MNEVKVVGQDSQEQVVTKKVSPKAFNKIVKKVTGNFKKLYKGVKKGGRRSLMFSMSIANKMSASDSSSISTAVDGDNEYPSNEN